MRAKSYRNTDVNPSLVKAIESQNLGNKVIFNVDKTKIKVDMKIGETPIEGQEEKAKKLEEKELDFYTSKQIDKAKFIRIYTTSFQAISSLKSAGMKILFSYIFPLMEEEFLVDSYYLNYEDYSKRMSDLKLEAITERYFEMGISDLLKNEIIYKHRLAYIYFINISYLFNGDRLKFIKEKQKQMQESTEEEISKTDNAHIKQDELKQEDSNKQDVEGF